MQWLIDFLSMLIVLCVFRFQYIPNHYFCQVPFTDTRGLGFTATLIYCGPMTAIGAMYYYIVHFIGRSQVQPLQQHQHRANQRDFVVLRRIFILVTLRLILCLPAILLWVVFISTGHLYPFIYHF